MSERTEYYERLEREMRALLPRLQESIALENWRWFEEWVRAGEYGLAAEVAAEGLAEVDPTPPLVAQAIPSLAAIMHLDSEPIHNLQLKIDSIAKQ